MNSVKILASDAKRAAKKMAMASSEQKNRALSALIKKLKSEQERLLQANREDKALARAQGLSEVLLDRLSLENRLDGIIHDIEKVIMLDDPIHEVFDSITLPNQLQLAKQRTPLGVLGVIYESRPNVTLDITALAIKSGNCALLRGGSETLHTNRMLLELIQEALIEAGLPKEAIQMLSSERSEIKELLQLHAYIDLIIPRGSAALQEFCREHSTIPVVTGGIGICHLFVDASADLKRSIEVIVNAKTQRPTVCNALDTLLVHANIASTFLPQVAEALSQKGVALRLDERAAEWVGQNVCYERTGPGDWDTEWLSLVLGIKVVQDVHEAIEHVQLHSSGHSDGILTQESSHAELFIQAVDSAAVYVNASTRFTDGAQFGLGAEVAISTQKLHARGPMGLKELTTYKWVVRGDYQVRES